MGSAIQIELILRMIYWQNPMIIAVTIICLTHTCGVWLVLITVDIRFFTQL